MSSDLMSYLFVGACLFAIGAIGFLTRRNLIIAILSAEMMLNGVALNLVAFSYERHSYQGEVFTVMVLTVAACEAGLALALTLALYRQKKTLDLSVWNDLGEEAIGKHSKPAPPRKDSADVPDAYPKLTPAGIVPGASPQETLSHV